VVIAIIGILIALLLPAVQAAREAVHRMQCTNHLKQLSLACHMYHDAHNCLPPYCLKIGSDVQEGANWLVMILPFIEQQGLFEMIQTGGTGASINGTENFRAGYGVRTDNSNYRPWRVRFALQACPSDSFTTQAEAAPFLVPGSYRANTGDCTANLADMCDSSKQHNRRMRGPFIATVGKNFSAIEDGTSNTFLLSEALTCRPGEERSAILGLAHSGSAGNGTPDWCMSSLDPNILNRIRTTNGWQGANYKGRRWNCTEFCYAAFNTIQAPNTVSCILWGTAGRNTLILPSSSNHTGGANHSLIDGSVRFVSSTVDTGDSSITAWDSTDPSRNWHPQSPYGVYGAMGTAALSEAKSLN
jgi:hypothetical protein